MILWDMRSLNCSNKTGRSWPANKILPRQRWQTTETHESVTNEHLGQWPSVFLTLSCVLSVSYDLHFFFFFLILFGLKIHPLCSWPFELVLKTEQQRTIISARDCSDVCQTGEGNTPVTKQVQRPTQLFPQINSFSQSRPSLEAHEANCMVASVRFNKSHAPTLCQSLLLVTKVKSSWVDVTIKGRQRFFLSPQDWHRIFIANLNVIWQNILISYIFVFLCKLYRKMKM